MKKDRSRIVFGVSSGIGGAVARHWLSHGFPVIGTYRTKSRATEELRKMGASLVKCDFSEPASVLRASRDIKKLSSKWEAMVFCPATLQPIGPFERLDPKKWAKSFNLNFTNQMAALQELLSLRNSRVKGGPSVIFFSGGGVNDAPVRYSAYTVSKIAMIKMCEILSAELPDTRFVSIGPGWVDTKIHKETLAARADAGENYARTKAKLKKKDFTPMERVVECVDWALNSKREAVSGRNINIARDRWSDKSFGKKLMRNRHLLKLRKYGSL